jgi:hypothetical protein
MPCNNLSRVDGLSESHSYLVLQLVADILSVVCTNVLDQLLPRHSHLIGGRLLTVIKQQVGAESGSKTSLKCTCGSSVVLAASATASTATAVAVATVSSSSSGHLGRAYRRYDRSSVTFMLVPML